MTAKYYYRYIENNEIITRCTLVEIIRNDKKTYLVKCLDFCGVHFPGEIIRVRKKNIKF